MSTVAIIQARMGSTRLPGKSLMKLCRFSLLETVVRTVRRNVFIDEIVIATSNLPMDDVIAEKCQEIGIRCFRGDSLDVLSRFLGIANDLKPEDTIVRVTADNPINNHKASKILYERHIVEGNDYSCVAGLSHTVYEFINAGALLSLQDKEDLKPDDHEHVTMYIRERSNQFKTLEVNPDDFQLNGKLDKMLTIDSQEDYARYMKLKEIINIDEAVDIQELYQILKTEI